MEKLRLDLDSLAPESFGVSTAAEGPHRRA
jgi:hypothetical protein